MVKLFPSLLHPPHWLSEVIKPDRKNVVVPVSFSLSVSPSFYWKTLFQEQNFEAFPHSLDVWHIIWTHVQYQKYLVSHEQSAVKRLTLWQCRGKVEYQPQLAGGCCAKQQCPSFTKAFQMWNESSVDRALRLSGISKHIHFHTFPHQQVLSSSMQTYMCVLYQKGGQYCVKWGGVKVAPRLTAPSWPSSHAEGGSRKTASWWQKQLTHRQQQQQRDTQDEKWAQSQSTCLR